MRDDNVVNSEASQRPPDQVASSSIMRWEKFLPRIVIRVLLVEHDDSTRQVTAALLRKCSYRVAAVPDGLKAWEILKDKPRDIDLILMEVDLPSISGFALLTLIMEHEICRNIPIIMMSSKDSMGMVYKCMMRGAADFLMKPVRKNELKNLWQHVWRRRTQMNGSGHGPPDESVAEQNIRAESESNDASNDSSCYITSNQKNNEFVEKGIDEQSSFTKPDIEADDMCPVNGEDYLSYKKLQTLNDYYKIAGDGATSKNTIIISEEKDETPNNPISTSHSEEAIDLIGAFDNYSNTIYRNSCSNDYTDVGDEDYTMLDLSLRRSCASEKHRLDQHSEFSAFSLRSCASEKHRLDNHSESSAFSRYANKTFQPLHPIASTSQPYKDTETVSEREVSNHTQYWNTMAPQQPIFPGTLSFRGVRLNDLTHPFEQSNIQRRNSQEVCSSLTTVQQQANNSKNRTETKENPLTNQNRILQRSVQREEALTKFRLKRKERCYEKKVRYQSRKKLAEKRPRVKGQFVRKVQTAPQGNSHDDI